MNMILQAASKPSQTWKKILNYFNLGREQEKKNGKQNLMNKMDKQ